jgi:hypothetical protein
LDVGDHPASQIWSYQWIKLLALLYAVLISETVGCDATAEGKTARVRVQLDIERILSAGAVSQPGTISIIATSIGLISQQRGGAFFSPFMGKLWVCIDVLNRPPTNLLLALKG